MTAATLRHLVETGHLIRTGGGKRGSPYLYRVPDETPGAIQQVMLNLDGPLLNKASIEHQESADEADEQWPEPLDEEEGRWVI